MNKLLYYAWPYRLLYLNNTFSVYFDGRIVAAIISPSKGRWPVNVTINKKMYSFSKNGLWNKLIEINDTNTKELIGKIKTPFFSTVIPSIKLSMNNGDNFTWVAENFFSLRWKWKKDGKDEIEAIDSLIERPNCGIIRIITINGYKETTDLLIATGFFLSLLRRSKLSIGTLGLKRNMLPASFWHI